MKKKRFLIISCLAAVLSFTSVNVSANKVFDETVRGTTKAVNASGWSPGIYVALAQINDQYYSLKFSVGE